LTQLVSSASRRQLRRLDGVAGGLAARGVGQEAVFRQQADGVEAVALERNTADRDGDDLAAAGGRGIDQDALGRIAGSAEQEPRSEGLAGELEGIGGHFILPTSHE
jgi:hypothetical protein